MPTDVRELKKLVRDAKQATAELENADLRRVAFERVLDHLLGNGADDARAASGCDPIRDTSTTTASPDADEAFADEQQRVDAIATYFKIAPDHVDHLFDASEEAPALALHSSSLDGTSAGATRQIALLVAGSRTALGKRTTTSHIREVVEGYRRLDSSNFMGTLAGMTELSVLGGARSPNRVVRMKVTGAEKARDLAQRLIGE